MPISDIFKAIGLLKEVNKGGGGPPSARAGMAGMQSVPSGMPAGKFDFNKYMQAWQLFFQDFFGKKVPYFFKNIGPVMNQAGPWISSLPQDEKIAYGVLAGGHVFVLLGIVLLIVL